MRFNADGSWQRPFSCPGHDSSLKRCMSPSQTVSPSMVLEAVTVQQFLLRNVSQGLQPASEGAANCGTLLMDAPPTATLALPVDGLPVIPPAFAAKGFPLPPCTCSS